MKLIKQNFWKETCNREKSFINYKGGKVEALSCF